jgi:hypothetical protein
MLWNLGQPDCDRTSKIRTTMRPQRRDVPLDYTDLIKAVHGGVFPVLDQLK